jgi:hypothetical protein
MLHRQDEVPSDRKADLYRLERGVWSEHLTKDGAAKFKSWVDAAAPRFLEEANRLIGETELPKAEWPTTPPRAVGIGLFYYEED